MCNLIFWMSKIALRTDHIPHMTQSNHICFSYSSSSSITQRQLSFRIRGAIRLDIATMQSFSFPFEFIVSCNHDRFLSATQFALLFEERRRQMAGFGCCPVTTLIVNVLTIFEFPYIGEFNDLFFFFLLMR